jgi:RNase P subunit RPR2
MVAETQFYLGEAQYKFVIDEKDEMDTLHKIIILSNPRTYCSVCRNNEVKGFKFTTNKDKEGNTYVNVKCKCGARSKLGQYKTGGYFWHEFEVYQKEPVKQVKAKEEDDINF